MMTNPRGFTLLIAILLATIAVTLGVSLLDIAYKQVILASTAKQSQYGFYTADSAMECALYYDQQFNAFSYTNPRAANTIICNTQTVTNFTNPTSGIGQNAVRKTSFSIPCAGGGTSAIVTIYKYNSSNAVPNTILYANGYNTCDANDPRRVERGLKVSY